MAWFTVDTTYVHDRDLLRSVRPKHRDYLGELAGTGVVVAAGPWADDSGGFTIFQVAGREALDELLARDPYTTENVAASRDIREWKPVIGRLAQ
jgi:uncharacterized protein YciI